MKHLDLRFDAGVSTVTLNRPDVRNAFNDEVIAELTAVFLELGRRPEVRCVVLAASGTAFCAGADLNWMKRMAGYSRDENLDDATALARMLEVIYECPKPTLAKVQGDVYAGGLGLVAACDIAIAADTAHYCVSEVRIGLIPATISPYLIRAMGARAAHRWFLTAERFGAARATACGLVHEAVPAGDLDARVAALTRSLVQAGPEAVKACKKLLHDVAGQEMSDSLLEDTAERIADIRVTPEGREGISAFLDKRKPNWLAGEGS
ncbi:MAG: enoyl-CoA hydratase/isomerase family protein [Comamonadaceae bacterium]|jgi:methylglutaconyl-CoA hydratase|nr:enoyl-CoA hydratase/isomerase family protein [Comamonadaceae bacterium]